MRVQRCISAEHAFVVGGQMLHQHKGHARVPVGGQAGEKRLEGSQPTGRGAEAYNRKVMTRERPVVFGRG